MEDFGKAAFVRCINEEECWLILLVPLILEMY